MGLIYGINPVKELLRRRPTEAKEILTCRKEPGLEEILRLAEKTGVRMRFVSRGELDQLTATLEHQGIAAKAPLPGPVALEDILQKAAKATNALLVFLDQVADPQNLGAVLRSAECAGACAVVVPERRSAGITPAVLKASAGALEWMPLSVVTNLVRGLEQAKEAGFWTYAATASAKAGIWQTKFSEKSVMVLGSEGKGIRPLVQKSCDFEVSIPMAGKISSLNISAAAAVMFYEFRRQFPETTAKG